MRLKRLGWGVLGSFLILLGAGWVFRDRILWSLGSMLVDSEAPQKADIVLVLAGDSLGNRVLKGAELVREGYAPKVFLSNGRDFYGLPESEAAANFAVSHGYSRETLIAFHGHPTSTEGESRAVTPVFRSMGIHKVLLVTSPSHTARATRIFRKAAPDLEFHPVAAPDPAWCRGYWWTERECEKTWFFEEVKTITGPFGI